ncbi:NEL-type E3 ubiquitin ligase domain-containing protein [Pseudomonas sp. UBA6562]|uniref:NEL-type E3 ubiquitin ligase domain-containing protein n=1 Tax=Pseudomonas sp. UBA6562 TaxID=1947332 RepID=UPI0025F341AF|nr:NEL-type E3 ubiquitin ligase domain-containing protein [Pseudomonas sp. UBA6562]
MTTPTDPQSARYTDQFIRTLLKPWLADATPAQINGLRDRFQAYRTSHERMRQATVELISLQDFAKREFNRHLAGLLPQGTTVEQLEWRVVKPSIPSISLPGWTILQPVYRREPALLRLMQNFPADTSYYAGTGLVAAGGFDLVVSDTDALIAQCRLADVGSAYQRLLDEVFTDRTCALLVEDKRAGCLLTAEVALLKGQLAAPAHAALQNLLSPAAPTRGDYLQASVVRVSMLGRLLADVLAIELRDAGGRLHSVVLYLPSDPTQALRTFADWTELSAALLDDLRLQTDHQAFARLIGLEQRPAFLKQLAQRLKDDVPDLAVQAQAIEGDPFAGLVASQVEGLKADAKLLLVPSSLADATAARERLRQWENAGLALVGLTGFFIPLVGAVLLGQMVVQVLSEAFEGVQDWSHGHQHEALEHFLGVAETVAVTAAVAGGATVVARGFARSGRVDGLQPVILDNGDRRLWSADLSAYEVPAPQAPLRPNGLYGEGERRWLRQGQAWYEVHRPDPDGPWRLRHPQRSQAYTPILQHNGQRGWRLFLARPLEWQDDVRMLDTLWPHDPPLDAGQVRQVLRVAGMDSDELRGVLVENRALPVNLREALRRFETRSRIDRFFTGLAQGYPVVDEQIQAWCLRQPGIDGLYGDLMRETLLEQEAGLRRPLFDYLNQVRLPDDALMRLVQRDFPGLTDAYAQEVVRDASEVERQLALVERRVPLALARRARSLRQHARLSRAIEGLYFDEAYNDDTADLSIALLRRLPHWPSALNIEVREGSVWGRRVSIIDPQGDPQALRILVRNGGRCALYDSEERALELEIEDPQGPFQAIAALLSHEQAERLGLGAGTWATDLRNKLLEQLPDTLDRRLQLVGWRAEAPWFNPGQRLPDGRVGYPLSGRGQATASSEVLRQRIRALYPGLDEQGVEQYLQILLTSSDSPFDLLLEQEVGWQRLDRTLAGWEREQSASSVHGWRQQLALRLRNCWRLIGVPPPTPGGFSFEVRLDLSGIPVLELPVFPAQVEFDHITVLVLRNMRLREIPTSFLRAFGNLRRLNIGSNELGHIPRGLGYLVHLRILGLDHNRIVLDEASEALLSGLPRLSSLNMSYNPLGRFSMRFHLLNRLSWISLRHCQLTAWPIGLDLCGLLESADLRDNQLTSIPDAVLQMPLAYRRALMVQGNPIEVQHMQALVSLESHVAEHPGAQAIPGEERAPAAVRAEWLSRVELAERTAHAQRWDRLSGLPGSGGLFDLFGELWRTADFARARGHLSEQVWSMVTALDTHTELREALFARANEPTTCADSVAERFSDLQVQLLEAQANAESPGQAQADEGRAGRLVNLGRRLWRLARVEAFARQDMQQRVAEARGVDEIEVSLYYRIHLATTLDLPFQPTSMHFTQIANVTPQQLDEALQYVRTGETREALAESLTERPFWQRYLHEQHEQAFVQVQEDFDEQGSQLDEQMDSLGSEEYRQRWDALSVRRESALQALRLQLTLDLLETLETPPSSR